MRKKNFHKTPNPSQLSNATIEHFENTGIGKDHQEKVQMKRLSFDIPLKTHMRFKSLCSAHGKTMSKELVHLIENKIEELQKS